MIACLIISGIILLGLYLNIHPKICVSYKKEVLNFETSLVNSGLLMYGNFTFQSGITATTYFDMRAINSYPNLLRYVINHWINHINQPFDIICGVATGSIAPAAVLASYLDKPFIYVRASDKVKNHGLSRLIEGHFKEGDKVLLIDDVLTTGQSLLRSIDILKKAGLNVTGLAVIMDRRVNFNESRHIFNGYPLYAVTNIDKIQ